MHLTELFDGSLIGRADRAAIEYSDGRHASRTLTFGEVEARANQMAHELTARGLTNGDRLCVHLGNSITFIELFLACARLGVIFVPMNVLYRDRELRHIITDASPRAVVVSGSSDTGYPQETPRWTDDELTSRAWRHSPDRVAMPVADDDPAMIVYTSGTTGTAKGAVLTHANLIANARAVTEAWHITEQDRYLAVLPLFHVHGLANGIHAWLLSGCLMHLCERFDQRTIATTFDAFRPTLFFGVPTMYVRLLEQGVVPDGVARSIGANARLFVSGSAPLSSHVHRAFEQRYGHTILERYGMSEALMIAGNPYEGARRAGTVGMPFARVSVRIVDESNAVVASGGIGEVQVRSPMLFQGYWRQPDATRDAFVDGWFRTGDVGEQSADDYITLRGRQGELIISGGFNIYPREIEDLLLEDSRVREVAVVGVPDAVRGEVPVAYIVADESLNVDELTERCRRQLASFKTPRAFVRLDALPRTALGKVMKQHLPRWTSP